MNVNVMARPVKSVWETPLNTSIFSKGDDFEQYIRYTLLPVDSYDLLYKTNDLTESLEDYITYTRQPDYKYRSRTEGIEFFIESKFRGKFQDQVLEWCKLFQSKRYQELDHGAPVVVIAGLGGRPSAPERVFMMPLKHMKFVRLYPGFLQKYEIRPDRAVSGEYLRKILE